MSINQDYFSFFKTGNSKKLLEILKNNENLHNLLDNQGNTGLILGCIYNNTDLIEDFLQFLTNKYKENMIIVRKYINIKADNGYSALHYTVFKSNLKIFLRLISLGADVCIDNKIKNGLSLMHLAAQGNSISIMTYFHNYHHVPYDLPDETNATPLHWSAYLGNEESVEFLLSSLVYEKSKSTGKTLIYTIYNKFIYEIINKVDNDGLTAYHMACMNNKSKIFNSLIDFECDFSIKTVNSKTGLGILNDKQMEVNNDVDVNIDIEDVYKTHKLKIYKKKVEYIYNSYIRWLVIISIITYELNEIFNVNNSHFLQLYSRLHLLNRLLFLLIILLLCSVYLIFMKKNIIQKKSITNDDDYHIGVDVSNISLIYIIFNISHSLIIQIQKKIIQSKKLTIASSALYVLLTIINA